VGITEERAMSKRARTFVLAGALGLGLLTFLCVPALQSQGKAAELPEAVRVELLRLEETYHVLDRTAGEVWPAWTNYRDFPFLFSFENGLHVLVGHPNPPEGYILLPDLKVAGKPVHIDARKVEPLQIEQPLYAGGGISSLGTLDGKPVTIIDMSLGRLRPKEDKSRARFRTEDAILTYVHELFHCFQQGHIQVPYPNFRYNPDTTFAAYSEIEGTALEKAWRAGDPEESKRYLEDFLLARRLKRKGMAEFDKRCESGDEVREGTAVYSEVRSLEVLRAAFSPQLTPAQDPYYGGFRDIDSLVRKYSLRLHQRKTQTYSYLKGYEYGCYQALLLERLFPGWQAPFSEKPHFLDEEIARRIGPTSEDERQAQKRLETDYRFREVWARHKRAVEERDVAYGAISAREGRSYIISFKSIHQFLSVLVGERKKSYEVGLMKIYPDGVGGVRVDDIEIRFTKVPAEINQLYYFRVVDTGWQARKSPYALRYEKKEGEDVYSKVILTTPLFELKAPRVRIREEAKRVKIWILSRVA
jgi:hypothetical protein